MGCVDVGQKAYWWDYGRLELSLDGYFHAIDELRSERGLLRRFLVAIKRCLVFLTKYYSKVAMQQTERKANHTAIAQYPPQKVTKTEKSEVHEEQLLAGSHQACKIIKSKG